MNGLRTRVVAVTFAVVVGGAVACSAPARPPSASTGPVPSAPPHSAVSPMLPTDPVAELFVSPSGNDGSAGTQAAPLRSIAKAATLVKPGTEVNVADGSYPGSLTTGVSGTADARISFVAESQGGAKVVGNASDSTWHNTGDYVDIVGFDISGSTTDGLVSGGSYVRIVSNAVHSFRQGNCLTTGNNGYTLHDVDVVGNLVYGCGAGPLDHGIYVTQPRGTVSNNISYGNAGYGIQCWHNCNDMVISNNLVFGNATGGIVVGQGDSPNNGSVAADNMIVSNNIAIDNGHDGIREGGTTGPDNQFLANILWQNGSDKIALQTGTEHGTIVADPKFVNFQADGSGNYHLAPGSPAIKGGVALGAPPTDIDGNARPQNVPVTIGVYQQ